MVAESDPLEALINEVRFVQAHLLGCGRTLATPVEDEMKVEGVEAVVAVRWEGRHLAQNLDCHAEGVVPGGSLEVV